MNAQQVIERIRSSAAVALECLKSAHTFGDAKRYVQQVVDMIDVAVSLKEFEPVRTSAVISDDQVKYMVDRFLMWNLPANFNPDNGISFDPVMNAGHEFESKREPVGTNLFDATQAEAMVRYMAEGMPIPDQKDVDWSVVSDAVHDAIDEDGVGASDLERSFKRNGLLVMHEEDVGAVPARETAWLVERIGSTPQYITSPSTQPALSSDPWRATRFATEREANDCRLRLLTLRDECKAIEHCFINKQ